MWRAPCLESCLPSVRRLGGPCSCRLEGAGTGDGRVGVVDVVEGRVGVHEEVVVGDVPGVGACHGEGDPVATRSRSTLARRARTSLGVHSCPTRVTGSSRASGRVQGWVPGVVGDDLEGLVVLFRGGGAQVVCASAQDGERLAAAELDVQDLGDVPAAVGGDRAARFDSQCQVGMALQRPAQPDPEGRPVEDVAGVA